MRETEEKQIKKLTMEMKACKIAGISWAIISPIAYAALSICFFNDMRVHMLLLFGLFPFSVAYVICMLATAKAMKKKKEQVEEQMKKNM